MAFKSRQDPIAEVAAVLRTSGFSIEARKAVRDLEACMRSEEELRRLGRVLDDRSEDPGRRLDALLMIAAAQLRGLDVSALVPALERASSDEIPQIRAFGSGLLAKTLIENGDVGGACRLYDRSGPEARLEIMHEAGSHILIRGYAPPMEPLIVRMLTDPDKGIVSDFRLKMEMRGDSDQRLTMLLVATTDRTGSEGD